MSKDDERQARIEKLKQELLLAKGEEQCKRISQEILKLLLALGRP